MREWNTYPMQGQVKFYALGAAALVFGVFQAPTFASAFPQFNPAKNARAAKTKADAEVKEGAEFVDPTARPTDLQDVSGRPEPRPAEDQPQARTPRASSIGELVSMLGLAKSPSSPFADADLARARSEQPVLSSSVIRSAAASRRGLPELSGRRVRVKGVVAASIPVGLSMKQLLVAEPKDEQRVAYVVTVPRGDETEFQVGQKIDYVAVFGFAAWKPKHKGTLVLTLGQGLDKWQDEGMSLEELGTMYLRPNAQGAEPAQKSAGLGGWHFRGQVAGPEAGTSLATHGDGRTLYLRDGQLVEPGIRVLKVAADAVTLRVDNQSVTVRPW